MESQQITASALMASNVSAVAFSKNKNKTPVLKFNTNINHRSYNQQLEWNRYSLHTAGRYTLKSCSDIN